MNMYNVVQETMSSGVLLRAVTGSIFEAENNSADGVAIFVMCGLTAFRPNAREYIRTFGGRTDLSNGLAMFSKHAEQGDITCLYDENRNNKIYDIGELHAIVDRTLNFFAERGVRRVAMNGIRIKSIISHEHFAEASLLAEVKDWCSAHESAFESIDLVDKRGGFGRITFSMSKEGKATDPKAKDVGCREDRRVESDRFRCGGAEVVESHGEMEKPMMAESESRDRLPWWEDPDIDFERAERNLERWKETGSATVETMMAEYNRAKKIFETCLNAGIVGKRV